MQHHKFQEAIQLFLKYENVFPSQVNIVKWLYKIFGWVVYLGGSVLLHIICVNFPPIHVEVQSVAEQVFCW